MYLVENYAPHTPSPLAWLAHQLQLAGEKLAAYVERRQAYEELSAMSDRDLKDIGITRGDIYSIVNGTYH